MQQPLLKVVLVPASLWELITLRAWVSVLNLLPCASVSTSSPFLTYSPAFPLQCPHLHSGKLLSFTLDGKSILNHDKLTFGHLAHLPGQIQQLKGARTHFLAQRSDVIAPLEPAVTNLSPRGWLHPFPPVVNDLKPLLFPNPQPGEWEELRLVIPTVI